MRILITGAAGLVGYKLTQLLSQHTLIPTSREMPPYFEACGGQHMDITDTTQVQQVIARERPEVVIHCAANTDVDDCERHPDNAERVNVQGTQHIADACREIGAKLVYFSTDYIFDGTAGPYAEDAEPNPLGHYARTKLAGERIAATLTDHLIIRASVIYGYNPAQKNFATWLIGELQAGKPVRIVQDQYSSPTFADQLVRAVEFLLARNAHGVWHVGDKTYCNRHAFSLMIAEIFQLDRTLISPVDSTAFTQAAKRPMRGGVRTDKLEAAGFLLRRSEDCIRQLRDELRSLNH